MNVFHKVTIQSLKKNKTRTIVTIIGIMLSASMICAVTTFVSSIQNYLMGFAVYNNGDWHGSAENVDTDTYTSIVNSGKVTNTTYNHVLGYAKIDSQNEFKPYMYVIGVSENNFFDMMPVHLISGEYPKNTNEIMIPAHVLSNGGLNYRIGDILSLEIGERMLDGSVMTQYNPCYFWDDKINDEVLNNEVIEVKENRTYRIVGVYERPSFEEITAPGYTAITVSDDKLDSSAKLNVYYKMKKPAELHDFMESLEGGGTQNYDVLMFSGISNYDRFTTVLIGLAAIVIGLIMFGSVSLIYNAFAISVSERTKQFGLLSSVGATKKQLKKMVLFEALAVSAVGIPLGIGVGISGIGITLLLIGNKFATFIGSSGYDTPLRICVSWVSIIIATIVALITVLISAWIPSMRATKISAVEAIRQNIDINIKPKATKTSKLTYRLFGLPGVVASKYYKRNKKKYRTTIVSLFMSIVLFVSVSSFTDYFMESVTGGFAANEYDLLLITHEDDLEEKTPEQFLDIVMEDPHVTRASYLNGRYFSGEISEDYITDELIEALGEQTNVEDGYRMISGFMYFINDNEFHKLIQKYDLNKEDYYDSENPLAIAVDTNRTFNGQTERFVTIDGLKGDTSEILCHTSKESIGNINYTLKSGKTITERPFFMDNPGSQTIYMIYPMSMYEYVLPTELQDQVLSYSYHIQSENHAASYDNLKTILSENGIESRNFSDIAANEEANRNIITVIRVFAYGFIVLISLIATANVFNTISTNINLRRREFAMLKSIGMTQKGILTMMNFECLLYGFKALMLGLPVSALISYMIYRVISDGFELTYRLPWIAIGISVLSVFAVVFVTMLYSVSKIKKENPIDALKNENL